MHLNREATQAFSPFRQSQTEFSPNKSFYRNQDPLQVGQLDHIPLKYTQSDEDLDQLQRNLRLLNGKTPTTEWHLAETVDNKLKALELLQVGVSYMHYANKTRKDALFDMRADHERRIKELKDRKKRLREHRDGLYQLKDEYNIKKKALKKYKAYLEEVHYCKKCKRLVRHIKEHEQKHLKQTQPAEAFSSDLVKTLLKENQAILQRMQKLAEDKINMEQNMIRVLDKLETIKFDPSHKGQFAPISSNSPTKSKVKDVSVEQNKSNTSETGRRISKPPSINAKKLDRDQMDDVGLSPIRISPRLLIEPEENQVQKKLNDILNLNTTTPNKRTLAKNELNLNFDNPDYLDNLGKSINRLQPEDKLPDLGDLQNSLKHQRDHNQPQSLDNSFVKNNKSLLASDEGSGRPAGSKKKVEDPNDDYGGQSFQDQEQEKIEVPKGTEVRIPQLSINNLGQESVAKPLRPPHTPSHMDPKPQSRIQVVDSILNPLSRISNVSKLPFNPLSAQSHIAKPRRDSSDQEHTQMKQILAIAGSNGTPILESTYKHPVLGDIYKKDDVVQKGMNLTISVIDDSSSKIQRSGDGSQGIPEVGVFQSIQPGMEIRKAKSPASENRGMPVMEMFTSKSSIIAKRTQKPEETPQELPKQPKYDADNMDMLLQLPEINDRQQSIIKPKSSPRLVQSIEYDNRGKQPLLSKSPAINLKASVADKLFAIEQEDSSVLKYKKNSSANVSKEEEIKEALEREELILTPKAKIPFREFFDKINRIRQDQCNPKDQDYQEEAKRINMSIEVQYNRIFDKAYTDMQRLDKATLKAQLATLNNTIMKQKGTYQNEHALAITLPKSSKANHFDQTLQMSQSNVNIPPSLKSNKEVEKPKNPSNLRKEPDLSKESSGVRIPSNLQNLRDESVIVRRTSLQHYTPIQPSIIASSKNSIKKEIKKFDVDDPLENLSDKVIDQLRPSKGPIMEESDFDD